MKGKAQSNSPMQFGSAELADAGCAGVSGDTWPAWMHAGQRDTSGGKVMDQSPWRQACEGGIASGSR
eukprot:CAMPEP_0174384960 /NCGR_PEP_ID=MMETSP0811_2-20130205/126268_1 /TAXON_ID=73025 ORGANISM="Eutreptiella gymnastica-like, Strain CCMP1594" /NCGR_SAMPLE_ID=MMETSP0811_2 /ASSEMBLY_ACC=CAM_ASM_000667 /LENGTH=66 /DNA_ID=CAMNT_0015539089 /DNA_START=937 /DNA_END=1137 /DNA_ORIENTATION=-